MGTCVLGELPCSTQLIVTVLTDDLPDSATLLKSHVSVSKIIKAALNRCTTVVNGASWAQINAHMCSKEVATTAPDPRETHHAR